MAYFSLLICILSALDLLYIFFAWVGGRGMGWAGGIGDVGWGHLSLQLAWIPFLTTLTNLKSEPQETPFCSCSWDRCLSKRNPTWWYSAEWLCTVLLIQCSVSLLLSRPKAKEEHRLIFSDIYQYISCGQLKWQRNRLNSQVMFFRRKAWGKENP